MNCDKSFAYSCGKCLLHPSSRKFLNDVCRNPVLGDPVFEKVFNTYCNWLLDASVDDKDVPDVMKLESWRDAA